MKRKKATQPEKETKSIHSWQQSCQKEKKDGGKKKQTKLETSLKTLLLPAKVVLEDCKFCFFCCFVLGFFSPQLGDEKLLHVIAVTFYICARRFQSMTSS